MDTLGGPFDVDANSVCCREAVQNWHSRTGHARGRPESDRYQKEEDKFFINFLLITFSFDTKSFHITSQL